MASFRGMSCSLTVIVGSNSGFVTGVEDDDDGVLKAGFEGGCICCVIETGFIMLADVDGIEEAAAVGIAAGFSDPMTPRTCLSRISCSSLCSASSATC